MNNQTQTVEEKRQEILDELNRRFGIEPDRVLWLNARDAVDPWLPPDVLMSIARQHGGFKAVSVTHDKFIAQTEQQFYTAMVIDADDRAFTRSGAAKLGEKPNGQDIDTDTLASGRALSAALRDAGFDPFRSGSVVTLDSARQDFETRRLGRIESEAALRSKDLRQIHALAQEKNLVVGKNDTAYRMWLKEKFGVVSTVSFDAAQRAGVINELQNYQNEFIDLTYEFGEDQMAA